MEAPTSRYGALAAGAALLTIFASAWFTLAGQPCPRSLLLGFYAAATAEIIILCRVAVPIWVRGLLILLLIASLTTLTARTDVFGVRRVETAISDLQAPEAVQNPIPIAPRAAGHGSAGSEGSGGAGSEGSAAEGGAKVVFAPGNAGDGGWAELLNTAYDQRLGGARAKALLISGIVRAERIGKDVSVQANWSISDSGASLRCGNTSALGSNDRIVAVQFGQAFGTAIARSLELRRASCP